MRRVAMPARCNVVTHTRRDARPCVSTPDPAIRNNGRYAPPALCRTPYRNPPGWIRDEKRRYRKDARPCVSTLPTYTIYILIYSVTYLFN
jgi:hypothetical protein